MELSRTENAHQLAMKSKVSYPTIDRYINKSNEIVSIDSAVLAKILIDGMGLTIAQAKELRLGDIFDIVEVEKQD